MELAAAQAKYAEIHEAKPFHDGSFELWSEKRTKSHPYRYDEGVTVWVAETDLNPHDHFLGGAKDCPDCSGGAPSPHDESA